MMERNCVLASYRLFAINDGDLVVWEESITGFDDEEALVAAKTRSGAGLAIEVWDVARLVGRILRCNEPKRSGGIPEEAAPHGGESVAGGRIRRFADPKAVTVLPIVTHCCEQSRGRWPLLA